MFVAFFGLDEFEAAVVQYLREEEIVMSSLHLAYFNPRTSTPGLRIIRFAIASSAVPPPSLHAFLLARRPNRSGNLSHSP